MPQQRPPSWTWCLKLLKTAEECRRRFNGHELVAEVVADVKVKDGIPVSDDDTHGDQMTKEKVVAA